MSGCLSHPSSNHPTCCVHKSRSSAQTICCHRKGFRIHLSSIIPTRVRGSPIAPVKHFPLRFPQFLCLVRNPARIVLPAGRSLIRDPTFRISHRARTFTSPRFGVATICSADPLSASRQKLLPHYRIVFDRNTLSRSIRERSSNSDGPPSFWVRSGRQAR